MNIVLPSPIAAGAAANVPFQIKEDSIVLKVLTCVPIIGIFVSQSCYTSLKTKLLQKVTVPHMIELVRVRLDFQAIDVVRNILSVVLLVELIARGVFSAGLLVLAVPGIVIFALLALGHIVECHKNYKIFSELQTTGHRAGMVVV